MNPYIKKEKLSTNSIFFIDLDVIFIYNIEYTNIYIKGVNYG
ncbi:hypothetical protein LCGT_1089 [Lactococcus garvieae ATCC 49156]|uniref:Uncharacterized protein n=1 Tax=Lactococcus garvieae (strain Lg2) TaxID=420890 RepID=F9VE18_LACGL|nr:hypothetical protein LCGT_1089 [Lactococcus garvieae ATCC 49156]BAK60569.1 hypothetical protein LCGL_1109 [Lactococcus garvieae Lg2]